MVDFGAGAWPLTGRDAEVGVALDALVAGRGVVLAGPPGVGKTRVAREVADRLTGLDPGTHVEWVTATSSGAGVPLAPFSHLVDDLPEPVAGSFAPAPLAPLRRRLLERAAGGRLLLVVDDAHLLDDASATLVHQLGGVDGAGLVATVRSRRPSPDAVVALWKDGRADRLELQPLTQSETATLLRAVLGGPVTAATVDRLWSATLGNVLFLRELVRHGHAAGRLADTGGWWSWRGELGVPDRLPDLIDTQLGRLDAAEREVVELVALAEPMRWEHLGALVDTARVESLGDRGVLIAESLGPSLVVRLAHPLYGDVLVDTMGRMRRRRLVGRLVAVDVDGGREVDEAGDRSGGPALIRRIGWQVELGVDLPAADLLGAARRCSLVAPRTAHRLAEAAAATGAEVEAAVVQAQTDMFGGDGGRAEARLAGLVLDGLSDVDRVAVTLMRANNLTFGLRRPDDALVLLDPLLDAPADRPRNLLVRGQRVPMLLLAGRLTEVLDELEVVTASRAASAADRMRARLGAIPAVALTGRPRAAVDLAAEAFAATGEVAGELPHAMGQIGTGLMVAQHWLGEFAAADGLARFAYDQGVVGDVAIQRGVGAFHLGLSALWRGRVVEADGWFAAAVTDLGPADLGFLPSAVDNWRATRALLGGRADADEPGSRLPLYETERLRLGAVVAAARGDRPTARRGEEVAVPDEQAAYVLGVEPEALGPLREVARRRLARLQNPFEEDIT